jgi:hypothetical protein
MKKILSIAVLAAIIFTTSCKKNGSGAGSWSFEGVRYSAGGAVFSTVDSSLTAMSGSNGTSGTLSFYFPSATVTSGTYAIVNYDSLPLSSNKLYIRFINDASSFYYFSTGHDNASARVTVSSAGKISVAVSNVYLESYSSAIIDSSQLTAVINQQ